MCFYIAIHFLLFTGCRPQEAAYVVLNKTIVDNDYIVPHYDRKFKATSPIEVNKTEMDYFWLLPPEAEEVVKAIMQHASPEYGDFKILADDMRSYFQNQVMKKIGVKTRYSAKRLFNMRSIRAYRATEWLKLFTEYKVMKWVPEPPNPLTHTNEKTVKDHYATRGSDNKW